ncbi:MAG: malto-oligosyltrehalose synthase, partial [Candidatus Dormibacteraeota bacterium]|nr:malto-oligosyltrehalose synthase [Candidatus Dormibacteraeota bacterium]
MPDSPRAPLPVLSTYRLQLGPDLTLDQAAALMPYLDRLGVTHVYCSPVLQAAPGSTHGYDVVDHGRVSRALGGDAAWERLCASARRHGMGVVLDIVPNHMAIAGRDNRLWWDLLENGPSSRYATYFDIAWDPPEPRLRNTILAPVLGDHYGRVLERGELTLHRDGGRLVVRYFEQEFPIAVDSLTTLLRQAAQAAESEALSSLAARCSRLPELHPSARSDAIQRHAEKESILEALGEACEDPRLGEAVDREMAAIAADPDREDHLLSQQHYRLARWQVGGQDVDYRRFFDIPTLVGLRVEDPDVFEESHRLVLRWASEGLIDGLRIDHVDGLRDPGQYLARLFERAGGRPIWVEKILERGEELPSDWPVAGTTGYDAGAL